MAGQRLHGNIPAGVERLPALERLDGSSQLKLAIGLPLRNREALTHLLHDLYNPSSPRFHQYLTADQFARQFGPTEEDYQGVVRFARAHGLTVTGTHPNRTLVDVSGAVADIETAFHLRLRVYQHPTEARRFYAPDAEPMLDLDIPVLSISGLDNFILPRPMNLKSADWNADTHSDADAADYLTGSGPSGYFIGGDFRAAYAPGVALNGAGQSVGLFELDGYFPSDIAEYETLAKLPTVALTNILLDGFNGTPGSENIEVALDIDMAVCMAPGLLQVMVYEGTTPDDVLNRMATDNAAKQLSSSWGFPITPARNKSICNSRRRGSRCSKPPATEGAYGGTATVYPPSDEPNLTVVGGTSLTTGGPGGAWASETTWSGSGGGISSTYPIPSWQQGLSMAANHGSTTLRNIPDVACLADVLIWLIADDGSQGSVGGTSAATPLWAGFTALINQQAAANGRPTVGFLNPALYAIGESGDYTAAFHDITTGNNTNSVSPDNFFAVPGYDLCTGWGSPAGGNLINALASPPDALQIVPSSNFVSSGPAGGPFTPSAQTLLLTDLGTNSFNWALGVSASWLNASPPGGTLTAEQPVALVTLTLNPAASALSAGGYAAVVWLTNLSDGAIQSRQWILDVVAPPVITRQPAAQNVPLGGTAIFSAGTASNALLFFQWQDNGTNLSDGGNVFGSAASTLTISNVTAANAGTYKVTVSNAANAVISDGAALSILSSAPVIISQPASQTAPQGATVTFSVTAAGNAPLSYQWRWNNTILGSTSNVLTLTNILPGNAGSYFVVVSNSLGSGRQRDFDGCFFDRARGDAFHSLFIHGRERRGRPQRTDAGNQREFLRHDADWRKQQLWNRVSNDPGGGVNDIGLVH